MGVSGRVGFNPPGGDRSCRSSAQGATLERISQPVLSQALRLLDGFMADLDIMEIDQELVSRARQCAEAAPLGGYHAVHCAAGLLTAMAVDAVLVSGDQLLLTTWRQFDASVVDINQVAD